VHELTKTLAAWGATVPGLILAFLGHITPANAAYTAAFVFSALQSYFLLRDKWWRERKKDQG
jgi:hypothetical protein